MVVTCTANTGKGLPGKYLFWGNSEASMFYVAIGKDYPGGCDGAVQESDPFIAVR